MRLDAAIDTRRARRRFGLGLRQARISAGLSQRSLANLAGLNQSTISRVETGSIGGLRYATLMRILEALQIVETRFVATQVFDRRH